MNYKFIVLLAISIFLVFLCNAATAQTILEVAKNESTFFDSKPELMGNYYVDNSKYYVVEHNNPFAGGISIYDEYGMRIEDSSLAEKVIITYQVKLDNETINVLKNYTQVVSSNNSDIASAVQSFNYLINKLDETETDVNYDNIKIFSETLNSLKNSTQTGSSSCNTVISEIDSLKKNKDYGTAYIVLEEYEKCISSIEPMKSNLDKLKNQIEPASETLKSSELLELALGDIDLSNAIKSSKEDTETLKNLSSLKRIDEIDINILRNSLKEIESGIDKETAGFEIRIDPKSRILTIIGIGILLIIIIIGVIFVKRMGTEFKDFKVRKEEEEITGFGDFTVVVTESKTRDPVANAGVALINLKTQDKYKGTTESNGTLTLRDLVTGEYEMEVASKKHETEKTDVIIDPGVNRSMVVLRRK